MKTKIIITGLLAIALAGLFAATKAPAQGKQSQPGCIILGFGQAIAQDSTGRNYQTGLAVTWVERGPNAADIPVQAGDSLGKAVEMIQSHSFRKDHYEYQPVVGYGWMVFIR